MNRILIISIGLMMCYFVGCTYTGHEPCPYYCGVEHKHKGHTKDYNCEQEVCIHMIEKT
jgi:hypothetical protein